MKKLILLFCMISVTATISAQKPQGDPYHDVDALALSIPADSTASTRGIAACINSMFEDQNDKARAIFIWTAGNIEYDVRNMLATDFYGDIQEKIAKALATRKGICENYAAIFCDLCSKCGITAYFVPGYTRTREFPDYLPHAWCVAMVNGQWYAFDPTWGAGVVTSGKFIRKIDNKFFMAAPKSMITTHMPFDYLWQLLEYPLDNQEFISGTTRPDSSKSYFNYPDSISTYAILDLPQQLAAQVRRIEQSGVMHSLIIDRLRHLKTEMENIRLTTIYGTYNSASTEFGEAVKQLNDFVNYRNMRFIPESSDENIQSMLSIPVERINGIKTKLGTIQNPDTTIAASVSQLTRSCDEALTFAAGQQTWLTSYLAKGRIGRKAMFYNKITWFGIPLN